jgi:NAD(P)-dependent dehydrogenase (short-subunit alcohol dehydrogenase family)
VINTNLIGTINAIQVALPYLSAGASIIATGSTAALMDTSKKDVPGNDPGGMAYVHSTRALANYVHDLATELAPLGIRANVVHPTSCNTPMLQSEPMYRSFRPDLQHPNASGRRAGFRRATGDEDPLHRTGGHQQCSVVACLRRGRVRNRHAVARRRRRSSQVVRLPQLDRTEP